MATPLNKVLREARLDACMSLRDVEKKTGVHISHLSRIERVSKNTAFVTVAKLARLYGVSLDEITKETLE